MSAVIVLQQMLVLFAMMAVGIFFWKKGWVDESGQKAISKLVVNVFNPLLVVNGIMGYDFENTELHIAQNMMFAGIYFLVLWAAGILLVRILRFRQPQKNYYQMMMLFSNIGFIGIPVVTALLGKEYVLYVAFYVLIYNVLLYTYGIFLAIKSNEGAKGEKIQFPLKKILNPGTAGCVLAILIFACQIPVAKPVQTFVGYMGEACVPLSMILIGISFAQMEWKALFSNLKMYLFLAVKHLVIPIAAALICRQFPIDAGVRSVFVIECAVPVGSIITLIAQEYGPRDDSPTIGVVLSTVLSVATIPVVALFL